MRRASVLVGTRCNNACLFCAQEGFAPPDSTLEDQLANARRQTDEVTLVGGEPTIDPRLEESIRLARQLGFVAVGIQTNGRRLADTDYAQRLAAAGLTDVAVSLQAADRQAHDYHTGMAGSFAQTVAGLAAARAAGLTVVATTVLTRSNCRILGDLPWLLHSRNVSAWAIEVPRSAGRLTPSFDRLYPRLGLAVPFALHALTAADRLGLPAWIRGAPRCLLGPFAARSLDDTERAFAPGCASCAARAGCSGVDELYLARFGGDELRRQELPVAATKEHALARLFVGVGPHLPAVRPSETVPTPPAQARRSLPLLGKTQPSRAEVSPSTPRRTGEALQEIFPDLFVKPARE